MTEFLSEKIVSIALTSARSFLAATALLFVSAFLFCGLAVLIKGKKKAMKAARLAARESRLNLWIYVADALLVAPIVTLFVTLVQGAVHQLSFVHVAESGWAKAPGSLTLLAVVF